MLCGDFRLRFGQILVIITFDISIGCNVDSNAEDEESARRNNNNTQSGRRFSRSSEMIFSFPFAAYEMCEMLELARYFDVMN